MKFITFLQSSSQLSLFKSLEIAEVLLAPTCISRFGTLSIDEVQRLASECSAVGIRPILLWDILMTEGQLSKAREYLTSLLPHFDCVRVYDPGAAHYLLNHFSHKIQIMLELGCHNLASLLQWQKIGGDRLERIIPSFEIDQETIGRYAEQLELPLEIYGLGRLPLSYSARQLLSPHYDEARTADHFEIKASSEESSHANLPVVQNRHGTFTFYMKDFCLVDFLPTLNKMGIWYFLIDLRFLSIEQQNDILSMVCQLGQSGDQSDFDRFKQRYPNPLFRGFFIRNKSDSVFAKLKNQERNRQHGTVLAEVVDVAKGRYMGAIVTHATGISLGDQLLLRTPEGKSKKFFVTSLFDSSYTAIEKSTKDQLIYLPHISGVSTKTLFFSNEEAE